jgi:hypothetical protein
MATFERDGVRFQYPENWTVEVSESAGDDGGWAVSVQSPETAFVLVTLHPDAESLADLADKTLDAIKAEYKELDAENAVETLAGRVAIGHNIDFLTLDTTVTCWTRCVDTPAGPLLVLCQTSEHDRDRNEPVLRVVCASLQIEEE